MVMVISFCCYFLSLDTLFPIIKVYYALSLVLVLKSSGLFVHPYFPESRGTLSIRYFPKKYQLNIREKEKGLRYSLGPKF